MKRVHIVVPDLFLPQQLAAYACNDLSVPALEKLLARSSTESPTTDTLESWLCRQFGLDEPAIAPLTMQADGLEMSDAYYLRADPVGISMQRDEMILNASVTLSEEEAQQLCKMLNEHFAEDGMQFLWRHPQRWYLRLNAAPAMSTHSLPQVVGADMHAHLPYGEEALHWHGVLNEIQMLFFEHAVNLAREQRGEPVVSGVWLWGGGKLPEEILQPFSCVAGDSELAQAFALAAGIPVLIDCDLNAKEWLKQGEDLLLVREGLRDALQDADIGRWRNSVQQLETSVVEPLLAALKNGEIERITLDVPSEGASRRFVLTRAGLWRWWRLPKSLLQYALLPDSA
jgi:hypothetical protein